jgi:isocitrate lyase
MKNHLPTAEQLKLDWANNPRWAGITRAYSAEDVVRLRGTVHVEHSLARLGAEKLWKSLHTEDFVNALGALTGNQAMQQVKAGLKAIYLSGWQVAADANTAGEMYPDQSLYPANSVPQVVRASTTPCCAPTSSTMPRATIPSTSCSRSWPMPKPVSAAC